MDMVSRLERAERARGQKYSLCVQSWERNWKNLTAFLHYPTELRKLIYTTNIIESFNASLRKYTKNKKVFPNDDAALKSIYLAAMQISKKWQKRPSGWAGIYNQLTILNPDRITMRGFIQDQPDGDEIMLPQDIGDSVVMLFDRIKNEQGPNSPCEMENTYFNVPDPHGNYMGGPYLANPIPDQSITITKLNPDNYNPCNPCITCE